MFGWSYINLNAQGILKTKRMPMKLISVAAGNLVIS